MADNKWKSWNRRLFQILQNILLTKTNRNLLYDSANEISAQPCSPNSTSNTSRPLTTSMYETSASRVVSSLSPWREAFWCLLIFFWPVFWGWHAILRRQEWELLSSELLGHLLNKQREREEKSNAPVVYSKWSGVLKQNLHKKLFLTMGRGR